MSNKKVRWLLNWLKTSVWVFPVVLLIILVLFTALRISGTSTGKYYQTLYGGQVKDPNLIYGQPRSIRSDEWLVASQMIASQSKNNFPRVNYDMTAGQDLSLQPEVPTKDWPTIFKVQNWGYFLMPLEQAYAFKWWLVMYLLIVSCYFFILRVLPGNKLFAAMISIAVGLSPFELWWYQSGGFLTVAYGFLMAIIFLRLIGKEPIRFIKNKKLQPIAYTVFLSFLMACFGLILYPPFQIPIAFVLLFFAIGLILQKHYNEKIKWKELFKRLSPVIISVLIAGFIGALFITTHRAPIVALNNSIYPGHRTVESGTLELLNVFDSYVMPFIQSDFRGGHFITNQSESSNFILLLPFLILPGIVLMVYEWRKKRRIDWLLLALEICAILIFIRVFTPYLHWLFKFFLLHKVPNKRLVIGMGFLGIMQMIYLVHKVRDVKMPKKPMYIWAVSYGAGCFLVLAAISVYIKHHFPMFVLDDFKIVLILAFLFAAMITAILADKRLVFASLFLLFTLGSSFKIIPLYKGLGVLTHSELVANMESVSHKGDTWATVGDDAGVFENFGLLAGRRSISGTQVYPQLDFWKQAGGSKYENIYNREGHAFFTDSERVVDPIMSASTDSFRVKFECSNFIRKNVDFVLAVHELKQGCVDLVKTVSYPNITFYLYKVD